MTRHDELDTLHHKALCSAAQERRAGRRTAALAVLLLGGVPLLGAWAAGISPSQYLSFPPRTGATGQASFSWPVFAVMALGVLAVVLPFELRVWLCRFRTSRAARSGRRFPGWGLAAVGLGAASWVLAWTPHGRPALLQRVTFLSLWCAYVMVVNALTWRRTGSCLLLRQPGTLLRLTGLSTVFWWYFEFLNRFVRNWYYFGAEDASGAEYALLASLAFSTVLPAVLSTHELLLSDPGTGAGLDSFARVRLRRPRRAAWVALVLSCTVLAALPFQPQRLFFTVWLAPLGVLLSLPALRGQAGILSGTRRGRWRSLYCLALAGLVCGFFWEMWNVFSLPKWIYEVPFANRFHLFEMPLLGYAGYLPFGWTCAAAADVFLGKRGAVEHHKEEEEGNAQCGLS